MLKFTQIISQITFALLVQLVVVRPIIVERNFHAYYRLPLQLPPTPGAAQRFHILQCPHKSTTDIPAPKNMEICIVVGKYKDEEHQRSSATNHTTAPKSPLHTKVRYTTRSKNQAHLTKKAKIMRKTPHMTDIRPVRLRLRQDNNCAPHAARLLKRRMPRFNSDDTTALEHQPTAVIRQIADQRVDSAKAMRLRDMTTAATIAAPLTESPEVSNQHNEEYDSSYENDSDDSTEDYTELKLRPDTALKYLNAKDAIDQLGKSKLGPRKSDAGNSQEAETFFAENKDHRRGEKVHGYQNYYHRDEIFNDHIFYDDLQQRGHYRSNGKQHEQY